MAEVLGLRQVKQLFGILKNGIRKPVCPFDHDVLVQKVYRSLILSTYHAVLRQHFVQNGEAVKRSGIMKVFPMACLEPGISGV